MGYFNLCKKILFSRLKSSTVSYKGNDDQICLNKNLKLESKQTWKILKTKKRLMFKLDKYHQTRIF